MATTSWRPNLPSDNLKNTPAVTATYGTGNQLYDFSMFFGPFEATPSRPDFNMRTNQDTLPKALIGQNEYLATVMEVGIFTRNNFLTSYALPIRLTDKLKVEFTKYLFNPSLCPIVPERGVTRILQHEVTGGAGVLERRGMGMLLLHGFMRSSFGRQAYVYELVALQQSVIETQNWQAMNALLEASVNSSTYDNMMGNYDVRTVEAVGAWQVQHWDIFKKSSEAFNLCEIQINKVMERTNQKGKVNTYIIDDQMMIYLNLLHENRIRYDKGGQEAVDRLKILPYPNNPDSVENYFEFMGNRVYAVRGYETQAGVGAMRMLAFHRQIGEHFSVYDLMRGSKSLYDTDHWISKRFCAQIFDWDSDSMTTLSLPFLWENQTRTSPTTGEFLGFDSEHYHYKPKFDEEEILSDPFHFITDNNVQLPIRYLGHIYPGKDAYSTGVTTDNGASYDGFLTASDYLDMAFSTLKHLRHGTTNLELEQNMSMCMDLLNTMKNAPIDEDAIAFLKALADANKDVKDIAFHKQEPGKGMTPLSNLPHRVGKQSRKHGFLDLPKVPNPWNLSLPPGFQSMPGLRTIADAYKRDKASPLQLGRYGLDVDLMAKTANAVDFLNKISSQLALVCPGSIFLDPKYVSSWFLVPDHATALVSNLMVGYQHPLFITQQKPTSVGSFDSDTILESNSLVSESNRTFNSLKALHPVASGASPPTPVEESGALFTTIDSDAAITALPSVVNATGDLVDNWQELVRDYYLSQLKRSLVTSTMNWLFGNTDKSGFKTHSDTTLKEINKEVQRILIPLAKKLATESFYDEFTRAVLSDQEGLFKSASILKALKRTSVELKQVASKEYRKIAENYSSILNSVIESLSSKRASYTNIKAILDGPMNRTSLLYSKSQYTDMMKMISEDTNNFTGFWPSSVHDPEEPAAVEEFLKYQPFLDPLHHGFTGERDDMLPPALIGAPMGREVHQTSVHGNLEYLKNIQGQIKGGIQELTQQKMTMGGFGRGGGSQSLSTIGASMWDDDDEDDDDDYHQTGDYSRKRKAGDSSTVERMRRQSKKTKMLSDQISMLLDIEFSKHAKGNFASAFSMVYEASQENHLIRVIAQLLVGLPINKQTGFSLIKNDIVFPFNFAVFRPHIRVRTLSMIKMAAGGVSGYTWYAYPAFEMGDDAVTGVHHANFTWYHHTLIHAPETVVLLDDVFVNGYDGGSGIVPYLRHEYMPEKDMYNKNNKGSIMVVLLPRSVTQLPNYVSLTGKFSNFNFKQGGSHYPGAYHENCWWGHLTRNNNTNDFSSTYGYNYFNKKMRANQVMLAAPTWYPDRHGAFSFMRRGVSHYGPEYTYSGCGEGRASGWVALEKRVPVATTV